MVIAKMRAAHVPMEILGFHIEREYIGQQRPQGVANFLDAGTFKIGGCIEALRPRDRWNRGNVWP